MSVPSRRCAEASRRRRILKTKAWWEGYVKGSAPFLGVRMAGIRSTLHGWHGQQIHGHLDLDRQKELARALIQEKYTEEKLAGILLL